MLVNRGGRTLDADAHISHYGVGEAEYDEETGEVFYVGRLGLVADHVTSFVEAGGTVRSAASGSGKAWAVLPGGRAFPVVCGYLIPVMTEDGPSDGRCGLDALPEGMCEGHAAEYAEWARMDEMERAAWERHADADIY